jgi:hypothetical protein
MEDMLRFYEPKIELNHVPFWNMAKVKRGLF